MNSLDSVTRVGETQWLARDGDLEVGRGDLTRRPDGRVFVSVDAWEGAVFDRIAAAMVADLPVPVHVVVDENDRESLAAWERVGLVVGRREREYVVATDPAVTGLGPTGPGAVRAPEGVRIVPLGQARETPLRELDRAVRAQIEATVGWRTMPAEVVPLPPGVTVVDPAHYAVAEVDGRYIGMVRVAPVTRRPRIGLIAVLAEERRRGVGRALLAEVLGELHRAGTETVWAEVDESNTAALALIESVSAHRSGGFVEMTSNAEKS